MTDLKKKIINWIMLIGILLALVLSVKIILNKASERNAGSTEISDETEMPDNTN